MAVEYRVTQACKARAPSGDVVNLAPGIYAVVGDEPGRHSVRLIQGSREREIAHSEFQRLKAIGAVKRL